MSLLERIARLSSYDANPLRRQRANGVLRRRYGVVMRACWQRQRDPAWLSAMT